MTSTTTRKPEALSLSRATGRSTSFSPKGSSAVWAPMMKASHGEQVACTGRGGDVVFLFRRRFPPRRSRSDEGRSAIVGPKG